MKDKNGNQIKEGNKIKFKGKNGVLTFGSIQGVSTWFVKTDKEEIPICNVSEADLEVIGGVNA